MISSMDLSSLSVPDLSLFCGDLLPAESISVGSGVVTEENLKSLLLDGIKHSANESWFSEKAPFDDFTTLSAHDSGLGEELFGASWLDTKVDLLDFLEYPEDVHPVDFPKDEPEPVEELDSSSAALQVLQSMAEATSQMLATEESPFNKEEEKPTSLEVRDLKSMGLMELLTTEMHAVDSAILEPQLDLGLLNEPILSPVTPEDVDSVLSSGPSSPETSSVPAETAASLFSQMEMDCVLEESVFEESMVSSDSIIEISPIEITPISLSSQPTVEEVKVDLVTSPSAFEELNADDSQSSFEEELIPSSAGKSRGSRHRQMPYEKSSREKPIDRKQRKKQQNKDAATRYRQKKKAEQDTIQGEYDGLMKRNTELKEQVDQMTREIQYLKDLMADVYRAKGILPPKA